MGKGPSNDVCLCVCVECPRLVLQPEHVETWRRAKIGKIPDKIVEELQRTRLTALHHSIRGSAKKLSRTIHSTINLDTTSE